MSTQRVLPTFTTIVGQGGGGRTSIGDYDPAMLVHAEQSIVLHGEIPTAGPVSNVTTVAGMYDKGKAGLVVMETVSHYEDGSPAFTTRTALFIRGEGGWGGPRNPEGDTESELAALPLPAREPDEVVTYTTRPDQALLYRLSGDRNPLHSDPTFAKRAGFDKPILHGLCTYGFTGRALLHMVCGSDPERFGAMRARFSKPTMPGDALTVSVWDIGARGRGLLPLPHRDPAGRDRHRLGTLPAGLSPPRSACRQRNPSSRSITSTCSTEPVDLGRQRAALFDLAPQPRRAQRVVEHRIEGHEALGPVRAQHHARGDVPGPVPRAQGGPGHARRGRGLLQGEPPVLGGLVGRLLEQLVPIDVARRATVIGLIACHVVHCTI